MAHLPDPHLRSWKSGDLFPTAAELNWNFGVLLGLIETTAALARQPDAAGTEALGTLRTALQRIARLEQREASSERVKNERQYTPLAAFGAMQQQILQLSGPLRQAADQLRAELATARTLQGTTNERVAALEANPAPPAPSLAEFEALERDLEMARHEAHMAAQQLAGLRAEVAVLRKLVLDPDRLANKRQYAPLAVIGQIMRRIAEIEAKAARP